MSDKKLPIYSDTPPSEKFFAAFGGHGTSCSVTCDCGRTWFADSNDYEEGELENLRKLQRKSPDEYIESEFGSITYGHIDGRTVVHECICNIGTKYENFIINHAYSIGELLMAHAVELKMTADTAMENATKANYINK